MKKIERGSVKFLVLLIITTALFSIILYPIFGLVYCKLTNTEFVYSCYEYIIQPIIFSITFGTTFFLVDKKTRG